MRQDDLVPSIPTFKCKKGCHDCCGVVPFTDDEKVRASNRFPLLAWVPFTKGSWLLKRALDTQTCPFVQKSGCAIYEDRPTVCRLFGAVDHPAMVCPHGCGPRQKLTDRQGKLVLRGEVTEQ